MRLALECPTPWLETLQPYGDFELVLVKRALEDEAYLKYYRGSKRPKFLDNSVNECGEPGDPEDLKKAGELVGANYFISPDWLGNSEKTIVGYQDFITKVDPRLVIPVVQGASIQEAWECAGFLVGFMNSKGIPPFLAIPYDVGSTKDEVPEVMGLRRALVIGGLSLEVGIHLLGFVGIDELMLYRGKNNILSIDTGMPVLLGLQGKDILDKIESKGTPTLNQMDKEDSEVSDEKYTHIIRNIAMLRKYL